MFKRLIIAADLTESSYALVNCLGGLRNFRGGRMSRCCNASAFRRDQPLLYLQ